MAGKKNETINIEKELEKLKEIGLKLENNITDLDSSLKLYEDGVIIYRRLRDELNKAQRRVELLREDGSFEDFEE